jgi:hypothetical protein
MSLPRRQGCGPAAQRLRGRHCKGSATARVRNYDRGVSRDRGRSGAAASARRRVVRSGQMPTWLSHLRKSLLLLLHVLAMISSLVVVLHTLLPSDGRIQVGTWWFIFHENSQIVLRTPHGLHFFDRSMVAKSSLLCLQVWLVTVLGIGLTWKLRRRAKQLLARRRIAAGLCQCCSYDLRASEDRCPECGMPIPQKLEASA